MSFYRRFVEGRQLRDSEKLAVMKTIDGVSKFAKGSMDPSVQLRLYNHALYDANRWFGRLSGSAELLSDSTVSDDSVDDTPNQVECDEVEGDVAVESCDEIERGPFEPRIDTVQIIDTDDINEELCQELPRSVNESIETEDIASEHGAQVEVENGEQIPVQAVTATAPSVESAVASTTEQSRPPLHRSRPKDDSHCSVMIPKAKSDKKGPKQGRSFASSGRKHFQLEKSEGDADHGDSSGGWTRDMDGALMRAVVDFCQHYSMRKRQVLARVNAYNEIAFTQSEDDESRKIDERDSAAIFGAASAFAIGDISKRPCGTANYLRDQLYLEAESRVVEELSVHKLLQLDDVCGYMNEAIRHYGQMERFAQGVPEWAVEATQHRITRTFQSDEEVSKSLLNSFLAAMHPRLAEQVRAGILKRAEALKKPKSKKDGKKANQKKKASKKTMKSATQKRQLISGSTIDNSTSDYSQFAQPKFGVSVSSSSSSESADSEEDDDDDDNDNEDDVNVASKLHTMRENITAPILLPSNASLVPLAQFERDSVMYSDQKSPSMTDTLSSSIPLTVEHPADKEAPVVSYSDLTHGDDIRALERLLGRNDSEIHSSTKEADRGRRKFRRRAARVMIALGILQQVVSLLHLPDLVPGPNYDIEGRLFSRPHTVDESKQEIHDLSVLLLHFDDDSLTSEEKPALEVKGEYISRSPRSAHVTHVPKSIHVDAIRESPHRSTIEPMPISIALENELLEESPEQTTVCPRREVDRLHPLLAVGPTPQLTITGTTSPTNARKRMDAASRERERDRDRIRSSSPIAKHVKAIVLPQLVYDSVTVVGHSALRSPVASPAPVLTAAGATPTSPPPLSFAVNEQKDFGEPEITVACPVWAPKPLLPRPSLLRSPAASHRKVSSDDKKESPSKISRIRHNDETNFQLPEPDSPHVGNEINASQISAQEDVETELCVEMAVTLRGKERVVRNFQRIATPEAERELRLEGISDASVSSGSYVLSDDRILIDGGDYINSETLELSGKRIAQQVTVGPQPMMWAPLAVSIGMDHENDVIARFRVDTSSKPSMSDVSNISVRPRTSERAVGNKAPKVGRRVLPSRERLDVESAPSPRRVFQKPMIAEGDKLLPQGRSRSSRAQTANSPIRRAAIEPEIDTFSGGSPSDAILSPSFAVKAYSEFHSSMHEKYLKQKLK